MKLIRYNKRFSGGKETITLPDICVVCLVQSDVPLTKKCDGEGVMDDYLSLISFEARKRVLFFAESIKKDHYIFCSFSKKLIKEAVSLLEEKTEEEIKIIKEYEKDKIFDFGDEGDKDRINAVFIVDRINARKEEKEERAKRIIRKKELILNLLLNGSKEDLKRLFELFGPRGDKIIDEMDEKTLEKL